MATKDASRIQVIRVGEHILGVCARQYLRQKPEMSSHVHLILRRLPLPITQENIDKMERWLKKKESEICS